MNPNEARLRARIGGLARAAKYDGREMTARARRAFITRFEDAADPGHVLPEIERQRRARAALKAHMCALALKSARARRRRLKEDSGGPVPVEPE